MKFSCESGTLQKGISIVEKAISSRTSLPVLENIFFELNGGQLKLRGNDLEIGIENVLPIEGTGSDGSILVRAKTISSIMSKLQNQKLNIEVNDKQQMVIKAENVDFDILCTNSDEYPVFPDVEKGAQVSLSVETLKQLVKYTIFSVSFDETKQFLNGVLIKKDKDGLFFVSTDGYRLSLKTTELKDDIPDFSLIVPYKAMNELFKIIQQLKDEEQVKLNISENQVAFTVGESLLVSRVIKGQFPDYNQVLPAQTDHSYVVSRRLFLDAAERAAIIASASNNVVRLAFDDKGITIRSSAPSLGDFKEDLSAKRESGEGEVKVAFNVKLIVDAVKIIESDDVVISFNGGLAPCKIQPVNDESYTYIIMPIRTSDYNQE